jgi:outer membrane protein OmpA-like peptidoglycan-associated protein
MGGFDIFSSTLSPTNQWEKPVNIGYPINSPEDDIYFVVSPNKQRAYYSSFKAGGYGEKDIYKITFKTFVEPQLTVLKGCVTDAYGNPIIGDVFITVTDNETGIVSGTYHANTVSGCYLLILPSGKNYNVTYEVENYLFQSTNIDVAEGSSYKEIHDVIQLQPLVVGSKIILKNLFFDFDKSSLRPASNVELNKLIAILTKYPNMVVEISAHTDSQGTDAYNLVLSEQRAKSVVDFLIHHGIPSFQLVSKGYGETQPAQPNTNPDGSDNPVNRQLNRRVELKILRIDGAKKN